MKKQLLVEGKDDEHVVRALCKRFGVLETFEVIDCKGIDRLIEQIPVRFKQSDIDTLGIIVDADSDIGLRWASLRGLLLQQGFQVPEDLPTTGLILTGTHKINIGIWLMPNNDLNGMLEDFISFLVPIDDKLLPIVNTTLKEIEEKKLNKYATVHRSKAFIHFWLSCQEDPGTPMGLAITKRYLTTDQQTCLLFVNWLSGLFK